MFDYDSGAKDLVLSHETLETLNWECISQNPGLIEILRKYPERIVWKDFAVNPAGADLILSNSFREEIWENLPLNPNPRVFEMVISRLEEGKVLPRPAYISSNPHPTALSLAWMCSEMRCTTRLAENPGAVEMFKSFVRMDQSIFTDSVKYAMSTNPGLIDFLNEHYELIDLDGLAVNPKGLSLYCSLTDRVNLHALSANPAAIDIINRAYKSDPDSLNWANLSSNPAGIRLLRENPSRIDWDRLCRYNYWNPLLNYSLKRPRHTPNKRRRLS